MQNGLKPPNMLNVERLINSKLGTTTAPLSTPCDDAKGTFIPCRTNNRSGLMKGARATYFLISFFFVGKP